MMKNLKTLIVMSFIHFGCNKTPNNFLLLHYESIQYTETRKNIHNDQSCYSVVQDSKIKHTKRIRSYIAVVRHHKTAQCINPTSPPLFSESSFQYSEWITLQQAKQLINPSLIQQLHRDSTLTIINCFYPKF